MIYLIEFIALCYLCWKMYRYLALSFVDVVADFTAFISAVVLSSCAFSVFDFLIQSAGSPLLLGHAINLALTIGVYFLFLFYLKRLFIKKLISLKDKYKSNSYLKSFRYVLMAGWMLIFMAVNIILVNLSSFLPQFNEKLDQDSFYLHVFKINDNVIVNSTPHKAHLDKATRDDYRNKLFDGLSSGWNKSKDVLADISGSKAILERVAIVKELSDLKENEKLWLIKNNKPLNDLLLNESLKKVVNNGPLMQKINRASQGSLEDIASLMTNKSLEELMRDKQIIQSIRDIDLYTLRDQVHKQFPK